MYIMASEPAHGMTAPEIEAYYADKHSPQNLADAYAITHAIITALTASLATAFYVSDQKRNRLN